MQILVLIPALLVFLYSLYKLVKDDYVFIRKGISLEQSFDIAFVTIWVSLFFSRLLFLLFHYQQGKNIFFQFFSFHEGGFSLLGAVIGALIALFVIGKYKKIPLGRLSDFFTLSFLYSLPVGFLVSAVIVRRGDLLYVFLSAILYLLLLIFFVQFLYPRLMNRTLSEGTLSILFLIFFCLISLVTALLGALKDLQTYINSQNIATVVLLLFCFGLLIKAEHIFSRNRRMVSR